MVEYIIRCSTFDVQRSMFDVYLLYALKVWILHLNILNLNLCQARSPEF
jgi:hypothetical protein